MRFIIPTIMAPVKFPSSVCQAIRRKRTARIKLISLCVSLLFLPLTIRAFAQTPTIDNVPLPASYGVGQRPGGSGDGGFETVNLGTGELTAFIPAFTLPQREGAEPLVLGFTYDSTQFRLRSDVSITTAMAAGTPDPDQWGQPIFCDDDIQGETFCDDYNEWGNDTSSYLPLDNITSLQDATGNIYYDNYSYTVQPTDTNQFYPQPIQVNLPVLKATIEYEGDASAVAPGGDGEIVKPVVCVTNFTFTDWYGAVHTFGQPYHAASECNTEAAGFENGGGYDVLPEMESDDSSSYRINLSNFSDFTVTDARGTVYHFTDNSCAESLQYYPNAENNGIYYGGELGSANTRSCGILAIPSSIVDKNGNTITISGGSGNFFRGSPVTITDTLGRSDVPPFSHPFITGVSRFWFCSEILFSSPSSRLCKCGKRSWLSTFA